MFRSSTPSWFGAVERGKLEREGGGRCGVPKVLITVNDIGDVSHLRRTPPTPLI